ncbi:endonuclease/exonuclease/phosphatase family protein [Polymorphospora sp. NPDC051019]|uniref:endonuclease/exonuclease/phosphatase family protein n=1 Tax=Polymorphospora sp. NPDC051019 TaxID=3155725 RepID=UPI003416234A
MNDDRAGALTAGKPDTLADPAPPGGPTGAGPDSAPADSATPAGGPGQAVDAASPVRRRWCLGTRLVVAGTALWTLFLAAHVLLTGRWWPWLIVESTPPVALVVVPLLLLAVSPLARPVRRWLSPLLAALVVAGLSLGGLHVRVLGGEPTGTTPPAPSVKVMAWNTDIWTMDDDPDAFFAYLREQRADVYLLQEYLRWEDDAVRVDDLARIRAAFPGHEVVVEGELVTISRLPVVATHPRPVPGEGTDWYWRGNKAQRVDVRFGDAVLSIYNVHLFVPLRRELSPLGREFYDFVRDQYHLRQAELATLRADVAANPNPVVVAGDFNTPWVGSLVDVGPGLRRHDPAGGSVLASSWPTASYNLPRLWRLDWLLTTDDLDVAGYRFAPNPGFSDHLAQHFVVSQS